MSLLAVLLLGAPMLFMQGLPPPVPAPAPAPNITVTNNLVAPPPDPEAIAEASVTSSQAVLAVVVAPVPVQWANELLGLPDIWRTTPPELTYNNGAIRDLAELIRNAVAVGLLALAIFVIGASIATRKVDKDALAKPVFAALLSMGNLTWWQIGIDLNNGITSAIGAPDLPNLIRPTLQTTIDPTSAVGTVVIVIVYAIVSLLVIFSLLFRIGMIDILIAAGGLALLCYATPQSQGLAQAYTRVAVGTIFGQILFVVALRVASVLAGIASGGVLGTLIGIVVLIMARSMLTLPTSSTASQQGNGMARTAVLFMRRRFGL